MATDKMYSVNPMVKLPDNLRVSEVMYKMGKFYNLPQNVKETYYEGQIPEFKPKAHVEELSAKSNNMGGDSIGKATMEELKHRQQNILEKLKKIKETLHNFKEPQFIPTSSSAEFDSLTVAHHIQGLYFMRKIDALKHYLFDVKRMRNHLEQVVMFLHLFSPLPVSLSIVHMMHLSQVLGKEPIVLMARVFPSQSVEQMEKWQEFVLKQLFDLRDEMKAMAEQNHTAGEIRGNEDMKSRQTGILETIEALQTLLKTEIVSLQTDLKKKGVILDVVVSANPAYPPYFLLPVKKFLQSDLRVMSTCSVHSSVDYVDPNVLKLFKDDRTKERGSYDISLTVLWKNQNMKSLMVNPLKQCAIVGEANILRYIARLFPATSSLNYESQRSFAAISETDYWLDTIRSKFLHGGNEEKQSFLKQMNSKLGTSTWMDGSNFGLCDVFFWSVILQLHLGDGLPSNVSSWFKRTTEAFGVEEAGLQSHSHEKTDGNGSCAGHLDRKGLEDFLTRNGIQFQTRNHKEVFTVEALMDCVKDMPGVHMKNLFLKDKKRNLYLLAARHDVQVKLNDVGNQVGAKDLRFGDEDTLLETLGVRQGCVTIYALLNDSSHRVTVLLDDEVTKTDQNYVNFHPMTNDATLGISPQDLQKFLKLTGHKVHLMNL